MKVNHKVNQTVVEKFNSESPDSQLNADREHWFARIVGSSVILSIYSLSLFRLLPRPMYLLIAVPSPVPSFRRSVYF